ncbi:predicted protein [Histoplasma capsulatum var. duboisii H88]|uniref:Predicted protein n=1 Tax=Ajellomyces capsulatus (strain H88) TaxID=544711 RepID=F0UGU1_AJEC8|nr:predicted protein [Histoplasma capsulatum var. duboisii H88]
MRATEGKGCTAQGADGASILFHLSQVEATPAHQMRDENGARQTSSTFGSMGFLFATRLHPHTLLRQASRCNAVVLEVELEDYLVRVETSQTTEGCCFVGLCSFILRGHLPVGCEMPG